VPESDALQRLLNGVTLYADRLVCAVVHLNDTYLIDEQPHRKLPGFPRVIATIRKLREHVKQATGEDRTLAVHSGDFLGPSRLGKKDKGASMVELLNRCGLAYCVIGNHEFDYKSANLIAQLGKATFQVVSGNVTPPSSLKACDIALWPTQAEPLVAVTGVVSKGVHKSFDSDWKFTRATGALLGFCERTQNVPFHVVLTHATRDQDRIMRKALVGAERTIVLGGHDHHIDWGEWDATPGLFKNRANLESVRVVLFLAGGDSAMQRLNNRYEEIKRQAKSPPTFNDATVDALLSPLNATDAKVFRRWIENGGDAAKTESVPVGYFDEDDDLPADALARRLAGMPLIRDMWSHVLRYDDFEPPAGADTQWVTSVMDGIREPSEDEAVCDFSTHATRLDARDEALRSGPTDFGLWVAECIRLEGNADIAILNSGAFRADTYLGVTLTKRDLLDTFLYDDPGPGGEHTVIVLRMNNADIDALLTHGRGRLDMGSYPQVSDRRDPSRTEHIVAISSYILLNEKSIDGYIEALAMQPGRTSKALRGRIRSEVITSFPIVPALVKHGGAVGYVVPPTVARHEDDATAFVRLAKDVSVAFNRMISYDKTPHAEWNAAFRRVFSDRDVRLTPDVRHARDGLCTFLRTVRHSDIRRFLKRVTSHQANFADGVDYLAIFKAAAASIPGLNTYR
jgi:2',3'-cyclic-nucleotide 2'-phosphodiesterase (5'-nucleotidase family)